MKPIPQFVNRVRSGPDDTHHRERTIAVACQGGGSHAAFTGGVLDGLFDQLPEDHRIVGLSGASGGAVSATGAWYGHLAENTTAGEVLKSLWDDVAASPGWESWLNELTLLKTQSSSSGSLSSANPYTNPGSEWGRQYLEETLTENIDFDQFEDLADDDSPALLVSAANVLTGEPTIFRGSDISVEEVVASSAIPQLFEAVEIDGQYYWDGFLAQNPPIGEFLTDKSIPPVEEIWVIRLTPRTSDDIPRSSDGIYDRTQELVENLALTQELRFLEKVNEWVANGDLTGPKNQKTTVRMVELTDEQADTSRVNRRTTFIDDLYSDGQDVATSFIEELD